MNSSSNSLRNSWEEERHAIFRERKTSFRKENVIFSTASPFCQLIFLRPVIIEIEKQITLAVLSHGNAPFFRAFSQNRQHSLFAINVFQTQTTEF